MPTIKIYRKRDWTIGSKVFEVFMDGARIGYLSDGEINEFEVPAGQHKLHIKIGRFGSNNLEYTVFNKDSRSFAVSINYIPIIVFVTLTVGALFLSSFLMKTHKGEQIYKWFFTAFIAVFGIYWQTAGRNTYLKLKEVVNETV